MGKDRKAVLMLSLLCVLVTSTGCRDRVAALDSAIRAGDLAKVQSLLAEDNELANTKGKDGCTPLMLAAYAGQRDVAGLLIDKGAAVDARDNAGYTPLHWAGNKEAAELLVAKGANVDAVENRGRTALHLAAFDGQKDIVRFLVAKGANVNARAKGNNSQTPLHLAVLLGNARIVEFLISSGASVDARDEYGMTPLYVAAANGRCYGTVQALLASGAEVNAKDQWGATPLEQALGRLSPSGDPNSFSQGDFVFIETEEDVDSITTIRLLLSHGADANARNSLTGQPILIDAAFEGQKDLVEALLAHGADVNVRGRDGISALHLAAYRGHKEVVELLIANGAALNIKTDQDASALWLAKKAGHEEIAALLREHGAVE
ncbi:MAG: ankyrin repeat domain-containing protein [Planctomycetota bacterium]